MKKCGVPKFLLLCSIACLLAVALSASGAHAQLTTYAFDGIEPLLDANYYAGVAQGGVPSTTLARSAFFASANAQGTQVAFYIVNIDIGPVIALSAVGIVDIGDTSSWRIIPGTINAFNVDRTIAWSPSGQFVFVESQRIDIDTGDGVGVPFVFIENIQGSGIDLVPEYNTGTQRSDGTSVGVGVVSQDSWWDALCSITGGTIPEICGLGDQIGWARVTEDANLFVSEDPLEVTAIVLTRFSAGIDIKDTSISPDGSMIAFAVSTGALPQGDPNCGINADSKDIYILTDVEAIIAAGVEVFDQSGISAIAPTSLADPRIIAIRTVEGNSYKTVPTISADNQFIVYAEDFNNVFSFCDQPGTFAAADFDIMMSNADGSDTALNISVSNAVQSADDTQYAAVGNQFISGGTQGGFRLLVNAEVTGTDRIFIVSVVATTDVSGEVDDLVDDIVIPVDTTGDGVDDSTITTTDNTVQVTADDGEPLVIEDPSGTEVEIEEDTIIVFPPGAAQEIVIETPTNPVEEAQLPPDADVDAIPVVRTFGPAGTEFFPPITITITYNDAEIIGLDESSLTPYLFNDDTGIFDIAVLESDIVLRDTVNNIIQFKVSHFSTYGLGAKGSVPMPQQPWASYAAMMFLLALGALSLRRFARASD